MRSTATARDGDERRGPRGVLGTGLGFVLFNSSFRIVIGNLA